MVHDSPIVTYFFYIVICCLVLNRVFFAFDVYDKTLVERSEDKYLLSSFCNLVDHREIGRHTAICMEAERRLGRKVVFHVIRSVVDDTLQKEVELIHVVHFTLIVVTVIFVGMMHGRYMKSLNYSLPTLNYRIKQD